MGVTTPSGPTDRELTEQIQARNGGPALELLWQRYARKIVVLAGKLKLGPEDIGDAEQELFMVLRKAALDYKPVPNGDSKVRCFNCFLEERLLKRLHNIRRQHRRRQKHYDGRVSVEAAVMAGARRPRDRRDDSDAPESAILRQEMYDRIYQEYASLTGKERRLLSERLNGVPLRASAVRLGVSMRTIQRYWSCLFSGLRGRLKACAP
jgi:RNA polymerase sigma factor (sigma-70 family)